jgi:hypothetical protein
MRAWAQDIPVRFGLTGSPLGNAWSDIWGEMFCTAGPAALGDTQEVFLDTYFKQVRHAGSQYPTWEIRQDGSADEIKRRIRPYAFSISKRLAALQLPEVVYAPLRLHMPPQCRAREERLREDMEVELASGTTLYALSQSKLGQLIRQFASGAVYTNEERTEWEEVHDVKLRALRDRVDELQGEPILVFAWFRHSKERILRDFKGFEAMKGTREQVERWNRGEIPGLVANPQGSGMGLNLQRGGSSVFWFDPEWSREKLDQGNGRIARLGQPDPYVVASVALVGDLDSRIWRRLLEKGAEEEGLIESVALAAKMAWRGVGPELNRSGSRSTFRGRGWNPSPLWTRGCRVLPYAGTSLLLLEDGQLQPHVVQLGLGVLVPLLPLRGLVTMRREELLLPLDKAGGECSDRDEPIRAGQPFRPILEQSAEEDLRRLERLQRPGRLGNLAPDVVSHGFFSTCPSRPRHPAPLRRRGH